MNTPSLAPVIPLFTDVPPAKAAPAPRTRFTVDGDDILEARLEGVCALVRAGVEQLVPAGRLQGILLGGGYGRGEGGVRHQATGDLPGGRLEFRIFLQGSRRRNERRFRAALAELSHELSSQWDIGVVFEIASLERLRRGPVTLRSYDLVQGHHLVDGAADLLADCGAHLDAAAIPIEEATRLLTNCGSRLLLARHRLGRQPCSARDLDYAARSIAEAQLALGDAVLVVAGRYHWSRLERQRRLANFSTAEQIPALEEIRAEHRQGVAYKLHPGDDERHELELRNDFQRVAELMRGLWLWLESTRLEQFFGTVEDYVLNEADKCPESDPTRNFATNLRCFGPVAAFEAAAFRHPRERLYRTLPVLLWEPVLLAERPIEVRVQSQLRTEATNDLDLQETYIEFWKRFR